MQRKVRMSRKNTVKHNYRKGVFVISIVLLILCAALFVKYHSLSKQAQANEEEIALLEDKKQDEENRTQQLQKQEADDFVEETARKLLNLVKPGDTTIKPNEK